MKNPFVLKKLVPREAMGTFADCWVKLANRLIKALVRVPESMSDGR